MKMYQPKTGVLAIALAIANLAIDGAMMLVSAPAHADGQLEEIIVTARRVEESLQSTPVAVSVVTAKDLYREGIKDMRDLTAMVPGVNLSQSGNSNNTVFSIRGMSRGAVGNVQPSATPYVNEVPLSTWGANIPTYDLASVQVFKGPQGTLFGRNSTSGAVLVTTQAPTRKFEGYAQVTVGKYDWNTWEGAVNIPLAEDMLYLRVAALVDRRDGYTKNLTNPGQDFDDRHSDNYRISLLFEPTKNLSNLSVYENNDTDGHGAGSVPFQSTGTPSAADIFCGVGVGFGIAGYVPYCNIQRFLGNNTGVTTSMPAFYRAKLESLSNTTTWDLGTVTLKNIYGYRTVNTNTNTDADGTFLPMIDAKSLVDIKQITDEFQVTGKAFDDSLTYIAGLFYLDQKPNGPQRLTLQLFAPVGVPFNAPPPAGPLPIGGGTGNSEYYHDSSRAVFAQVSYKLGALSSALTPFSVDFGMRHTNDKETVCSVPFQPAALSPVSDGACSSAPLGSSASTESSKNTYTLGLNYKPSDQLLIYGVTRSGYRSGGLNTPKFGGTLKPFQSYMPETVKDIELGMKSDFSLAGRPMRFNTALFQSKYSDMLSGILTGSVPDPDGDGNPANNPSNSNFYTNVGKATVKGVEADVTWLATDDLELNLGASWISKSIDQIGVTLPATLVGTVPTKQGLAGLAFMGSPNYSYTAGLRYTLPLSSDLGKLEFSSHYFRLGKVLYGSVVADDGGKKLDLRLDWYNIMNSRFDAALFVTNATDNRYPVGPSNSNAGLGINSAILSEPRMVGIQLRYSFGN